MAALDVFKADAFSMGSLTESINMLPFQPTRLGNMGLFSDRAIRTTVAFVEEKQGTLRLLTQAGRGSTGQVRSRDQRKVRNFTVPHVPNWGAIEADDVLNIRAFGSETELEAVSGVVNDELEAMRKDHEVTQEYHRIGATQGIILDGDGSTTIYDLFSEFGVGARPSVVFDFTDATMSVKVQSMSVTRTMGDKLGMTAFSGITAICGDTFFDSLVANAEVVAAHSTGGTGTDANFLKQLQIGPDFHAVARGFVYADIYWFNYRGTVGGVAFQPTNDCSFVPTGVPGLFIEILAPGDMMDVVGTRGRRFYASQEQMDHNKGVQLHTQSNTLAMCTRPGCLILGDGTH